MLLRSSVISLIRFSHNSAVLSQEYFFTTSTEEDHHFSGFLRISSAASVIAFLLPFSTVMPFKPFSSVTEGWGISIIEASSAGTPTVAFKVPGVSDSVENGLNGITVENGNRQSLTEAALEILRNPEKWWSSSVEVAKKYSWDKTAELWEKLIKEITDDRSNK